MNCMEARRMVTPYVNRTLTDQETEIFLDHIEHCSDCMEELDIYFTLYKAMDSLDSGSHQEYNFKKMLEDDIQTARRAIFTHKLTRIIRMGIIFAAEVLLILSVVIGYGMRSPQPAQSTFQRAMLRLHPHYHSKQAEELQIPSSGLVIPEITELLELQKLKQK